MSTHLSVSNSLRSHVRVAIISVSVTLEAAAPAASAAACLRRLIGRSGSSANRSRWGVIFRRGLVAADASANIHTSLHLELTQDVHAKPCMSSDRTRVLWAISGIIIKKKKSTEPTKLLLRMR